MQAPGDPILGHSHHVKLPLEGIRPRVLRRPRRERAPRFGHRGLGRRRGFCEDIRIGILGSELPSRVVPLRRRGGVRRRDVLPRPASRQGAFHGGPGLAAPIFQKFVPEKRELEKVEIKGEGFCRESAAAGGEMDGHEKTLNWNGGDGGSE